MTVTLRHYRDEDFAALHAAMSDFDSVRMLASWPYPADEAYTRSRFNTDAMKSGAIKAIDVDGKWVGGIGILDGEIGYSIAKAYWGQGIATQAVALKVAECFSDPENEVVTSCVFHDNPASSRVLVKNGFRTIRSCNEYCKARNEDVLSIHYELKRTDWKLSLENSSAIA